MILCRVAWHSAADDDGAKVVMSNFCDAKAVMGGEGNENPGQGDEHAKQRVRANSP